MEVSGPCIFTFIDASYTESADFGLGCITSNSTNTVTFKPATGVTCTINFTSTATRASGIDGHFIIGASDITSAPPTTLKSTNYVTIDGSNNGSNSKDLTINGVTTTATKSVIRIFGDNNNITIKNCIITNNSTSSSTTSPINITNYNSASINYTPDYITIQNNTLNSLGGNGSAGLVTGNSGTPTVGQTNLIISGNSLFSRATRSIMSNYVSDATISGNIIDQNPTLSGSACAGILLLTGTGAAGTFNVYNNVFTTLTTSNTTATGSGLGIVGIDNQLASPKIVNIYNNVIRGFKVNSASVTNTIIYGVRHTASSTCNVYNNSIYLPDLTNMTTFSTSYIAGIVHASTTETAPSLTSVLNIKNNSIFMDESSMKVWGIRRVGTAGTFTSENNIIYINPTNTTNGYAGFYNATDYKTLANWQSASNQDLFSYYANPNYTSSTNLQPSSAGGYAGTASPYTTDILGNTRAVPSTIGAYEATIPGSWKATAASTDWDVATNWVGDVLPTVATTVVIPMVSTNMPTISTTTSSTINSLHNYGSLTIAGTTNINITNGGLINSGAITGITGGFNFVAAAPQKQFVQLNTSSVANIGGIIVNNGDAGGLNFSGTGKLNIYGALGFGNVNSSTIELGNVLTLKSTALGTAQITDITNSGANTGNAITGTITQERLIPAKTARSWSFVASPVSQTINSAWQQQIHITGTTAGTAGTPCPTLTSHDNGFDATISNVPSMYYYDAAQAAGSRWLSVATTNATSLAAGTGYRLNVRGPRSTGCAYLDGTNLVPAEVTLSSTGTLSNANNNIGSFTINYNGVTSGDNFVLIGNPYPSPMKFDQLRTTNSGVLQNTYSIYALGNTSGNYAVWDGTAATFSGARTGLLDANGNIIPSGQALFVKGIATGTLALSFAENMKTASTYNGVFKTTATKFNEMLRIGYMNGTNLIDEIIIRYSDKKEVENNTENLMDIPSLNNTNQYLTSLKAAKGMAIQTRSLKQLENDKVALNVVSKVNGTFTLNFSDFTNFTTADIYLIDNYTKTQVNIKQNAEYSFTVDKNIKETQGIGRFEILFKKPTVTLVEVTDIKVFPNPATKELNVQLPLANNSVNYTLKVTDISGKVILQQKAISGLNKVNISRLEKGNYVIEITDGLEFRSVEKFVKL